MALINTKVDYTDVVKVNLWDNINPKNVIVTTCANNQQVDIVEKRDKYILCRTEDGLEGWCRKEFIK